MRCCPSSPARTSRPSCAAANSRLEDHQRVWSSSIWPGASLPRTEGTQKLKRRDLQRWAAGEAAGAAPRRRRARRSPTSWAATRRAQADVGHDAGRTGSELARSRRADDGAGGRVSDHARRVGARGRQEHRRHSKPWCAWARDPARAARRRANPTPRRRWPAASEGRRARRAGRPRPTRSSFPPGTDRGRPGCCGGSVCRPGSCPWRGSSCACAWTASNTCGICRSGGLRGEPPESHGRTGDPAGAACPLAILAGARHGEGVLPRALQPRRVRRGGPGSPTA